MFCPSCGERVKRTAKFCSNCGAALVGVAAQATPRQASRALPFALSLVSVAGMILVGISMTFVDDAPGYVGSPIAGLFHAIGAIQLTLGLGVLVCAMFLLTRGLEGGIWANAILLLGLVGTASLLVIVAEGTFGVIILALPCVLAAAAGAIARRPG